MKLTNRIALVLGAGVLCVGAASAKKPSQPSAQSLGVRYEWRTGTVAPPYQYSYTISLGPGARGRMMMSPSLTASVQAVRHLDPAWSETFAFPASARERLRQTMRAHGVFTRSWKEASPMNRPVGGGSENLEVRNGARKYSIPAFLDTPAAQADAQAVYAAINALVPRAARARLEAKRQKYQQQELKSQG